MDDNVTTPRAVRLSHALTGKPLDERTRDELEEIAKLARIEVAGTGKDGYATMADLRGAVQGVEVPTITRAASRTATTTDTQNPEVSNGNAD